MTLKRDLLTDARLRLVDSADRRQCWTQLDKYHTEKHGSNWLTERYLKMMEAASEDASINFQMHALCLVQDVWEQEGNRGEGRTRGEGGEGGKGGGWGVEGDTDNALKKDESDAVAESR